MPNNQLKTKVSFHFLQSFNLTDRTRLKSFVESIFRKEKKKLQHLQYIFCSDNYLLDINKTYLNHDFYTDIISFDLSDKGEPTLGEIYISVERVIDNANNFDSSFKEEIHRVIFHGALHLCGYKDKSPKEEIEMRKMEDKYLSLYFL
jgi:rRNA maturation RNase YbeY